MNFGSVLLDARGIPRRVSRTSRTKFLRPYGCFTLPKRPLHVSSVIKSLRTQRNLQPPKAVAEEKYDVYVNEPTPLQEGETKHMISIFVADEPGLINRVAGVFGRRGSNIESLAVGLNANKALFTIVANGADATINNLVKQLGKLVKVRYVEDITKSHRMDRELVMLKLAATPGPERSEVLQICDIFRARVVDLSDTSITLSVVGDSGKISAFESSLAKFGITELVRTGVISLKRGEELLEKPTQNKVQTQSKKKQKDSTESVTGADVYIVEDGNEGVWEIENVLDETGEDSKSRFEAYTLQIEVDNSPGVLNQVTGLFSRRGYNVQSLAVGPSEKEGRSRICMVVPGDDTSIPKLIKQLYRLVHVQQVHDMTKIPFVARELMLVKVNCEQSKRVELTNLASIFRSSICDVSLETVTVQMQGKPAKLNAFLDVLDPYGVLEVARTGCIALSRESKVSSQFLQGIQRSKIF
eukprot:g2101.t1